jgi:hypothetical protein
MYQIDVPTAVTTPPRSTQAGEPGYFTDGNPATGQAATILPAEFMNAVMRELLNLLHAAGIAPDKAKFDQITQAVQRLAQTLGDARYVPVSEKGQPEGVATLDDTGRVPEAQLPAIDLNFAQRGAICPHQGDVWEFGLIHEDGGHEITDAPSSWVMLGVRTSSH